MKIKIYSHNEDKLLREANKLFMSPTQYVNYLIEITTIEKPRIKQVVYAKKNEKKQIVNE